MKSLFILTLVLCTFLVCAQDAPIQDSILVQSLNQKVDDYVVAKQVAALDTLYADDFVFRHGSGRVEGKAGWMITVGRANYTLRQHDSVTVDMYTGIAIVKGKMNIQKVNKTKTDNYWLKYVRVYALRKHWQLISHITMQEQHVQ